MLFYISGNNKTIPATLQSIFSNDILKTPVILSRSEESSSAGKAAIHSAKDLSSFRMAAFLMMPNTEINSQRTQLLTTLYSTTHLFICESNFPILAHIPKHMLTAEQAVLWQKILNFQLDDPEAAFKFSERLARENGWNANYALRVISEYKKFIFLCCISDNGVTPSDAVDQAWHLHLTFTRSYWIDLCRDTLGREIHHNPTKGGDSEAVKYDAFYTDTNKIYTDVFQQYPPPDIWPENNARFTDIDFQRVNKRRNWVIRKPRANKIWPVLLIFTFGFGVIAMKSGDGAMFVLCFLAFFVVLLVVVFKRESWNKNDAGETSGCNTGGCGAYGDLDTGHHGHSGHGCHSGCSGCSSSGCSSGH